MNSMMIKNVIIIHNEGVLVPFTKFNIFKQNLEYTPKSQKISLKFKYCCLKEQFLKSVFCFISWQKEFMWRFG